MKSPLLLFDAAGVLFPANSVVGDSVKAKYKITDDQNRQFWSSSYTAYSKGLISTNQFLSEFALLAGAPISEVSQETFTMPFEDALEPVPGMDELFRLLKKNGYRLALLSDTAEMFARIIEAHGYYKPFAKRFLSNETGYLKSDPRSFSVVLEECGVESNDVLFIDDNPKNIALATLLGIKGILFTDSESLKNILIEKGII
jgi:HAD superfamily hydrolase (TIGR01509 family)